MRLKFRDVAARVSRRRRFGVVLLMSLSVWPMATRAAPPERADIEFMYREGEALYDAAEYEAAISKFTDALTAIEPSVAAHEAGAVEIKLALLFNIARAHEMAYEVDKDIEHLNRALRIYERYHVDISEMGDQLDAEARLAAVKAKLTELESSQGGRVPTRAIPPPPTSDPGVKTDASWKRNRNTGLGLMLPGTGALIAGVALAVVGSGYESRARGLVDQLADLGVPADDPAWAEGDKFISEEKRKGQALMGVGIPLAIMGTAAIGAGAFYLIKSKRARISIAPSASALGFSGIRLSGRF